MSTTPTPSPAPQKGSNALWWILGLLVGAVVVLGLGGMVIAGYLLKDFRVQQSGDRVEVSTPAGSIRVSKDAIADPGLPVYPGALVSDAGGTVEISSPMEEAVTVTAVRYRTSDSLAKVDEWYREQLGPEFTREGPGVMIRKREIFGIQVKSSDVAYIYEEKDLLRVVALERKGIYTEVALARIGRQETQ